ncbi:hypothetical protein Tco_0832267 [Tanacetum coccineum]
MSTLAEFMILYGGDNRPPMLEKHLYDSWKSRIELYMQNREHGRMILESVEHGPLSWPTIEENSVTRTKKYEELSATEKIQADCDLKLTNIILQGLPSMVDCGSCLLLLFFVLLIRSWGSINLFKALLILLCLKGTAGLAGHYDVVFAAAIHKALDIGSPRIHEVCWLSFDTTRSRCYEQEKKQQTYKLIIRSIDGYNSSFILVLSSYICTASLLRGDVNTAKELVNAAKGRLVLPVHVNAAITKGRSMISTSGEALFKGFMIGILEAGEKLWKLWSKYQKMKILEGSP